jgi:hypothetical protein
MGPSDDLAPPCTQHLGCHALCERRRGGQGLWPAPGARLGPSAAWRGRLRSRSEGTASPAQDEGIARHDCLRSSYLKLRLKCGRLRVERVDRGVLQSRCRCGRGEPSPGADAGVHLRRRRSWQCHAHPGRRRLETHSGWSHARRWAQAHPWRAHPWWAHPWRAHVWRAHMRREPVHKQQAKPSKRRSAAEPPTTDRHATCSEGDIHRRPICRPTLAAPRRTRTQRSDQQSRPVLQTHARCNMHGYNAAAMAHRRTQRRAAAPLRTNTADAFPLPMPQPPERCGTTAARQRRCSAK